MDYKQTISNNSPINRAVTASNEHFHLIEFFDDHYQLDCKIKSNNIVMLLFINFSDTKCVSISPRHLLRLGPWSDLTGDFCPWILYIRPVRTIRRFFAQGTQAATATDMAKKLRKEF